MVSVIGGWVTPTAGPCPWANCGRHNDRTATTTSAELRLCVDGQPHKSTGPAFTPDIVRSGNELAKRQGLLPAIDFHIVKHSLE